MSQDFDQSHYWRSRHAQMPGDPRSVGNKGHSLEQAEEGERLFISQIAHVASALKPSRSVLDLGCGYGRASRSFTENGYAYLGVDVSPDAIVQAKRMNPSAEFTVGDLGQWESPNKFDVVAFLYVLVHFIDDDAWRRMIDRSLRWVAPNGVLLIADEFPSERRGAAVHVVQRPLSEYVTILAENGFAFGQSWGRFHAARHSTCLTSM